MSLLLEENSIKKFLGTYICLCIVEIVRKSTKVRKAKVRNEKVRELRKVKKLEECNMCNVWRSLFLFI